MSSLPMGGPRWLGRPMHVIYQSPPRHETGKYFLIPCDHADTASGTHPRRFGCRRSRTTCPYEAVSQLINVRTFPDNILDSVRHTPSLAHFFCRSKHDTSSRGTGTQWTRMSGPRFCACSGLHGFTKRLREGEGGAKLPVASGEKEHGRHMRWKMNTEFGGYAFPAACDGLGERRMAMERKKGTG